MNELSKKKASLRNMFFMTIYQLITAIFGFILPNMIMHVYGAELHGYTTSISSIMSYIGLINAGLAPAAIQALYEPLAKNNIQRLNEVLNAINRFYTISGCLYTVAVTVIAFILPHILGEQLPASITISLMLVIGAGSTLECFIYSKYRVLLQADQRLYVVAIADSVIYFFRIGIQISLILNRSSIVYVMAIPAVMVVFRMLILSFYCKKMYSGLDTMVLPDNKALSKRWSAMIHQFATLIVNNTDVTLLTIFGNLVQVSIYSVYNLIFSHVNLLFNSVFSSGTVASFGRLIHEGKQERVDEAYNIYEFGYYVIVSFVYGVAASMILPFISIYTKGMSKIQYYNPGIAFLFIIIGLSNHFRMPGVTLITAAGHFKETQGRALLEAGINLSVSLLLIKSLGMYGLLIGTVCSFMYRTVDIIYYTHKKLLNIPIHITILRTIKSGITVMASVFIYRIFFNIYKMDSWLVWIAYAVIDSIITLIIAVMINYVTEKEMVEKCWKLFVRKKRNDYCMK